MESSRQPHWVTCTVHNVATRVVETGSTLKKLANDNPRRIVHGVKVGLCIILVSLLYYFEQVFEGLGVAAMWAVLTVVVVFEFSVGATLGKGVNRVVATVFGGMLGVGAHNVASVFGDDVEPFILALFVFLLASTVTFFRFIPVLKARYDYGLMIVILTFSLVVVSGYQDDEILDQANHRISAILVGCSAAVSICILICPVWAGSDLHDLIADNIDKLANFLQGFGDEYFKEVGQGEWSDEKKEFMEGFKSILNSKNTEDSLVNFAKWEPRHGKFRYHHPWEEYEKIGSLTRQLAYIVEALHRYLHDQNRAPKEGKTQIKEACKKMSQESGKALKEISTAMKAMAQPPSTAQAHLHSSQLAAKSLSNLWAHHSPSVNAMSVATVVSLLLDAVSSTVSIAKLVQELAVLVPYKDVVDDPGERTDSLAEHVVTVEAVALLRFPMYKDPPSLDTAPHQTGE